MDYKFLLQKYMDHVESCEGTDFTNSCDEPDFSKHEIEELNRLHELNGEKYKSKPEIKSQ